MRHFFLALIILAYSLTAQENFEMSLSKILTLEVESVTGRMENIYKSPAAIYVITQEDIEKYGYNSIPEALEHVPGIQVNAIASNQWSVSLRGFSGRFSDKLLVLQDGRRLYTSMFNGVHWAQNDVLMNNVERIEIIRGPGATLWGENAVNGVINIVTKKASETQGGQVTVGGGSHLENITSFHYGGELSENMHYRIFSKYQLWDHTVDVDNNARADDWSMFYHGMRLDYSLNDEDHLTFQAEGYHTDNSGVTLSHEQAFAGVAVPPSLASREDVVSHGYFIMGQWERTLDASNKMKLQGYYDFQERDSSLLGNQQHVAEIDFRHFLSLGEKHEIAWGLGQSSIWSKLHSSEQIVYENSNDRYTNTSAFVQDTIELVDDELYLTLGSKFGYNSYTHFEYQPSVRLLWSPEETWSTWLAISRTVRLPSRADDAQNVRFSSEYAPFDPYEIGLNLVGSEDFQSEKAYTYEWGIRKSFTEDFFVDITTFYTKYKDLRSIPVNVTTLDLDTQNGGVGEHYGFEVYLQYNVNEDWEVDASYALLKSSMNLVDSDEFESQIEEGAADNIVNLRTHYKLMEDLTFSGALHYSDHMPGVDTGSFINLDLGVSWKLSDKTTLSFWGKNLWDRQQQEYYEDWLSEGSSELERSFHIQLTHDF